MAEKHFPTTCSPGSHQEHPEAEYQYGRLPEHRLKKTVVVVGGGGGGGIVTEPVGGS